jgi:hypothetical protein
MTYEIKRVWRSETCLWLHFTAPAAVNDAQAARIAGAEIRRVRRELTPTRITRITSGATCHPEITEWRFGYHVTR